MALPKAMSAVPTITRTVPAVIPITIFGYRLMTCLLKVMNPKSDKTYDPADVKAIYLR